MDYKVRGNDLASKGMVKHYMALSGEHSKAVQNHTLHLSQPFGGTLLVALVIFMLIIGVVEITTRTEGVQSLLVPPNMGSRHHQLGQKLTLLEAMANRNSPVDCIIIGNSMVDLGFAPQAFAKGFKDLTQKDIRCFNFGIDASSTVSSAALAHILIQDFNPNIVIYGTDARDYAIAQGAEDTTVVLNSSWIQYRSGHFNIDGWLLNNSYLYRYRHSLSLLLRLNFNDTLRSLWQVNHEITADGFTPYSTVGTFVNDPPDPQDKTTQNNYYFKLLSNYEVRQENLTGLQQLLSHNDVDTHIIVIEMPVPAGYFYYFGDGMVDYQHFIDQISYVTHSHNVPFIESTRQDLIPVDGWVDYSHLNTTGARIFSEWIGQQAGEMVIQGKIDDSLP